MCKFITRILGQFNPEQFLTIHRTASLNVPQRDLGLALGLVGTFRFLGGAIGTTVSRLEYLVYTVY